VVAHAKTRLLPVRSPSQANGPPPETVFQVHAQHKSPTNDAISPESGRLSSLFFKYVGVRFDLTAQPKYLSTDSLISDGVNMNWIENPHSEQA
jgi:hypothetical protein